MPAFTKLCGELCENNSTGGRISAQTKQKHPYQKLVLGNHHPKAVQFCTLEYQRAIHAMSTGILTLGKQEWEALRSSTPGTTPQLPRPKK